MLIACECLNVIIESKGGITPFEDFGTFTDNDTFFLKDLGEITSVKISKKLPKFTNCRHSGSWIIHQCLFCEHDVYAVSQNSNGNSIVFDQNLLIDKDQMAVKTKSTSFSPFYKILINHSDLESDFLNGQNLEMNLPNDVVTWLQEQTALIEKNIQLYSDSQYAELERLRRRIFQDNEVVTRKTSTVNQIKNPKSPISIPEEKKTVSHNVKQSHPTVQPSNFPVYDSDEVFFLDDVDVKKKHLEHYVDLIPDELDVFEQNSTNDSLPNTPISRSLPVPVPQFINDRGISDKNVSPEVPTDIAASIEALARSLHGVHIFGDLPPPRCSTTNH